MRRLMADPAQIDAILRQGAERARDLAAPVMAKPGGWWGSGRAEV